MSGEAASSSPPPEGRRPRAFNLQTLAAAVAIGVALFWVARATRDGLEPANYWVRRLSDGDAEQRIDAAKGLGTDDAGPAFRPKAAEALAAALADPNVEVVAEAAQSLATLIQAEHDADLARSWSDALAAGLRDPRAEVRGLTAAAFTSTIRPPATRRSAAASDALADLVEDPDADVRLVATAALAACGTGEAAVRALVKVLESDAPAANLSAAARALASYPDRQDEVTLALLGGLKSPREEVRGECSGALESRRHMTYQPRRTAALVPALIAAAADPDRATRAHAAIILGEIGPEAADAVPALIAMLGADDDEPVRPAQGPVLMPPAALAAEALGRIALGTPKQGEAVEALTEMFHNPRRSEAVALAATLALARFPAADATPAVPRLVAILEAGVRENDDSKTFRTVEEADAYQERDLHASRAAEALGLIAPGSPREAEAAAALIRVLDSPAISLHARAAEALGRFGPLAKPALPRLREMMKLQDPWRRRIAGEAARRIEGAAPTTDGR